MAVRGWSAWIGIWFATGVVTGRFHVAVRAEESPCAVMKGADPIRVCRHSRNGVTQPERQQGWGLKGKSSGRGAVGHFPSWLKGCAS